MRSIANRGKAPANTSSVYHREPKDFSIAASLVAQDVILVVR